MTFTIQIPFFCVSYESSSSYILFRFSARTKSQKTVYNLMVVKYVKQQFKHGLLTEVKLLG